MLKKTLTLIMVFSFLFNGVYAVQQTSEENNVQKKVVVITGVTKGMGRALVCEFAKKGWLVAGCGRSLEMIQELQKIYGSNHHFAVVDITNEESVAQWANKVSASLGSPTLLINNAALINQPNVLWQVPSSEFTEVIKTNVIGSYHILHSFIPIMIKNGYGVIVNISSSSGVEGEEMFSPYCASKFAIEGLTQSLAKELPPKMCVVSLDPGVINTEMLHKAYHDEANKYPTAEERARNLVPFILNIDVRDNGKHLVAP